jgi:hypothetical protein
MNYIITENQLKTIIREQNIVLPHKFTGSHTVPANTPEDDICDVFHGFQLQKSGADMNGEVKTELDKFSNQGVWVSDVAVTVDVEKLRVDWEVTIDKSDDGQFWNGFTSRGAGCNNDIKNRWNAEGVYGNGPESIVAKIKDKKICKTVKQIELVKKIEFTNLGKNSFIQGFYRYKCGEDTKNTQPIIQKTSKEPSKDNKVTPEQPKSVINPKTTEVNTKKDTIKVRRTIKDLDVVSPNKYSVRIGESMEIENPQRKYDAILIGGLDGDGFKKIGEQLSIFKKGFGDGNVKAFRYNDSLSSILNFLKQNPKIPIFLFSAGCNFADELITSELVDKNRIYVIEPFNKKGRLNISVSNAITKGLSPRNIFVKKGSPGRGYGFSGASDSGAESHWDALRIVPEKLKF